MRVDGSDRVRGLLSEEQSFPSFLSSTLIHIYTLLFPPDPPAPNIHTHIHTVLHSFLSPDGLAECCIIPSVEDGMKGGMEVRKGERGRREHD